MENFNRDPDPHVNVMLQALHAGKVIAYRSHPKDADPEDALVKAVRASGVALFALDDRLAELTNTPPADVLRVREEVNALFVSVQVRIAAAKAATTTARDKLAADEAAFYLPSPVSDVADVLRDVEMRGAFNAADHSERDQLWQRMAQGELPELLAALASFAFGGVAVRARTVYRALAAERAPDRVREFALESEKVTWAESTLATLSGALDAGSSVTGVQTAVLH